MDNMKVLLSQKQIILSMQESRICIFVILQKQSFCDSISFVFHIFKFLISFINCYSFNFKLVLKFQLCVFYLYFQYQ